MSVSSKNNFEFNRSSKKCDLLISKNEKRENSFEKPKKYINLKDSFYNKEADKEKITNTHLSILNFIQNKSNGRASAETALTGCVPEIEYELFMINKYDENLNTSLSFISDFDLEEDNSKQNDSFNSSDNDDSLEEIEIKTKAKVYKRVSCDNIYLKKEIDLDFEKDWNDIKQLLLNKKVNH